MWWLFLISNLMLVAMGALPMDKVSKVHEICQKETDLPEEIYKMAYEGDISSSDMRLKCYIKCVLMKIDGLMPDGNFNLENLLKGLPDDMPEEGINAVRECYKTFHFDSDLCVKAHQMMACCKIKSPNTWYFV